jgi:hypothetical protein
MTPEEYQQYYKDIDKAQRSQVLGGAASGAATGASTGMAIGSIIPGVGTGIGAGVGALVGGIAGGFNAAPSVAEKENAIKLKELLRRQELGQLGLTEEEKQRVYGEQLGATTKAAQDVRAAQSGIAASLATGAGRAAIDRTLQEESVVRARAAAQQSVSEADFKRQAAETEEIDKRLGIVNKQEVEGKKAIGQAGIQTATMAAQEIQRINNVRGAKPTPEQLEGLAAYTGLSPEQLGPALEYFAANPESASILTEILTAGKAGVAGAK